MNKYLNSRCIVSDDNVYYYDSDDMITRADIKAFILENETLSRKYTVYRHYYKAHNDAIINRPEKPNNKPDNRLIFNYSKKLVDTYTGFAVGKPVQITLQEDIANNSLSEFNLSRNMSSLISRVWKESAIFGRAYFFVYGADEEIYVTDATPDQCFVIYDNSVAHKPLYAVRYQVSMGNQYEVTIYDENYQYDYSGAKIGAGLGTRSANPFHTLPIVEVVENDERLSVIANVKSLIDELDKALSEKANDVDYFADAYMKVLGATLSPEQLQQLRDTRIINLKSADEDGDETPENLDVDFLSKPNADDTQENLINRLVDNLYQISMIVNLNDKDFGNSTGVALEMKYKPMLNLATLKSSLFTESLKKMYQVVFASDQLKGIDGDAWKDLDVNYQYDLPHDTLTEAQTAQALQQLGISTETWLKVISIVNDPHQEEENMDKEHQEQERRNLQFLEDNKTDGEKNDDSRTGEEANIRVAQAGPDNRQTTRKGLRSGRQSS